MTQALRQRLSRVCGILAVSAFLLGLFGEVLVEFTRLELFSPGQGHRIGMPLAFNLLMASVFIDGKMRFTRRTIEVKREPAAFHWRFWTIWLVVNLLLLRMVVNF